MIFLVLMSVTSALLVVVLQIIEEPPDHAYFPLEFGTVICTLHHQQLSIHQLNMTLPLHVSPPTSLKSLLNQGISLADAKSSKGKCFAALHSNTVPERCNACNMGFHEKCSTGLKASTRDDQWKCDKCTKLQQNRLATFTNCQFSKSINLTRSQLQPVVFQNKLKI